MSYFKEEDNVKLCDVGDKLYRVGRYEIKEIIITRVERQSLGHYVYKDDHGNVYFSHTLRRSCFKTKEDAEKVFQTKMLISKKREMLREYEQKLNQDLGITGHWYIK